MRVFALTLVLAFGAVGCLSPGQESAQNGRLPDNALTTVMPSCRVANAAAESTRRLLYTAWVDGVALAPESRAYVDPLPGPPRNEPCYRSYEMQVWWRNFYCFFGNCALAAEPGTSIHGWGRAIDFEDGDGALTFDSAGYRWLKANAARFGFVHPAWAEPGQGGSEAWHWEYAG